MSSIPGQRPEEGVTSVKYQFSGWSWYWVSDSNETGGPEMVFFHTMMLSASGSNRLGTCVVR